PIVKMGSRETILSALKKNQPALQPLPAVSVPLGQSDNLKEKFVQTLTGIGGSITEVREWNEITTYIRQEFSTASRIVNTVADLNAEFEKPSTKSNPHDFKNVTLAILKGEFGVAENGAIWLTDANMGDPALPYICEHLILIIRHDAIVPTLHEAYEQIGNSVYSLGTFLAGPSKTADIEQSLVLGAHGPKSLRVFLLRQ
ncbi:MAG TPA: LUD domain-containing protein, partial [Cyclobacteriaceae bacterium]|nr:LUD domain-containing protein [Cyclobacteriaceae bacterium]